MGTNYYAKAPGELGEGLHIGKHSGGWDFLFRAHRDKGLTDCEAWRELLSRPGVRIVAEYGVEYTLDEFWPDAVKRPADPGSGITQTHDSCWRSARGPMRELIARHHWIDKHGHPFSEGEFC